MMRECLHCAHAFAPADLSKFVSKEIEAERKSNGVRKGAPRQKRVLARMKAIQWTKGIRRWKMRSISHFFLHHNFKSASAARWARSRIVFRSIWL